GALTRVTPSNKSARPSHSPTTRPRRSRRTSRDALLRHDLPHLQRATRHTLRRAGRLRRRTRNTHQPSTPGDAVTVLDELILIGTLTDDHETEYDGENYTTPSLIGHDDQEDTNGPA